MTTRNNEVMSSGQLRDRLMVAVEEARLAGSPVVGTKATDRARIVEVAVRRWSSFPRRNKATDSNVLERRVEDLAKGLCSRIEQQPSLAGPLLDDYRWLARKLAEVFGQADGPEGSK